MLTVGVHGNRSTSRRYSLWSGVDPCENQQLRSSTRSWQPALIMLCSSLLYLVSNCRICPTRAMRTEDVGCFFMDPCIPWLLMRFTLGCFWLVYYCSTTLSPPTSSQCTRKLQQYQSSVKDNFVVSFVRFFFKRFQFFVGGKRGG